MLYLDTAALASCRASQREATRVEDDDLPPEVMIGDVPNWALDIFSREGRVAFARFLGTAAPAAQWIRDRIRPARRVAFLGHIVFRVEGGLVRNEPIWASSTRPGRPSRRAFAMPFDVLTSDNPTYHDSQMGLSTTRTPSL